MGKIFMSDSDHYYSDVAAECLNRAKTSKGEADRWAWLMLAKSWVSLSRLTHQPVAPYKSIEPIMTLLSVNRQKRREAAGCRYGDDSVPGPGLRLPGACILRTTGGCAYSVRNSRVHTSERGPVLFPECLEPSGKPRAGLF
jgi:hypothetical protein